MDPAGYTDDEVRAEIEDFPFGAPDDVLNAFLGALDENDGEHVVQLPKAPQVPERRTLESFDRERVICVHELARALEEFSTKEPVPLFGTQAEFDEAAIAIVELMGAQRCPLKGR